MRLNQQGGEWGWTAGEHEEGGKAEGGEEDYYTKPLI